MATLTLWAVAITLVLFALWFRFICDRLLEAQTPLDQSRDIACSNSLTFPVVVERLRSADPPLTREAIDSCARDLRHDFEVLAYLLRHSGEGWAPELEFLRLRLYLQVMRYQAVRLVSVDAARRQLLAMEPVIRYFADLMADRRADLMAGRRAGV